MSDIAFITQPGHVPGRQRIIDQRDKAFGSLNKANEFRDRANWIRNQGVRVKGDAVRRDEEQRAEVRKWIRPGMLVDTCHCGILKVLKVNKKTATIEGRFGNFTHDLIYLKKVKGE